MNPIFEHLEIAAFLFGLIIGSFCNVLIHRLPRGESVVFPRSYCPQCKTAVKWYDNIPVISYLLLRGRCRICRARISLIYPAVELLSGISGALVVWQYGVTFKAFWVFLFLDILLVITFIDWFHKIIPDVLSIGGAVLGWVGAVFYLDISLRESLLGSITGAGVLVVVALLYKIIRKVDGLGGGDVKLMAMIGAFMGWQMVFPVLFIASFFGSLYGFYLMRSGGDGKTAVAFGSFLAPAATFVYFFGGRFWEAYLRLYVR